MRYLLILAALGLTGCAHIGVGFGPSIMIGQAEDLESLRKDGTLPPVAADAPKFERGF